MTVRDRLVRRIARELVWHDATEGYRDQARRRALAIVADLYDASAEGKGVERALRVIEQKLEQSA